MTMRVAVDSLISVAARSITASFLRTSKTSTTYHNIFVAQQYNTVVVIVAAVIVHHGGAQKTALAVHISRGQLS